jgi:hypothetical protein
MTRTQSRREIAEVRFHLAPRAGTIRESGARRERPSPARKMLATSPRKRGEVKEAAV